MRIIAGSLRGLVLNTFEADNIRPTLDRAREGVFNKIQFLIRDAHVLDLFAGTGAISLEFISRGASKVVTCDNNKKSIDLINQNFKKARQMPNLLCGDYLDVLNKLHKESFDIVFLDPPFKTDYGIKAILQILKNKQLKEDGIIIFEHSCEEFFEYPEDLVLVDSKKYGYIVVDYLEWK